MRSRLLPQNRKRELDAGSIFSCFSTIVHSPSIDLRISVLFEFSDNTDYPRSIVIREELLLSTINTDIFVNLLK